ncbi:MAG: methionyl-tRNA formyltransferase [Verrucomicrobia bacterium]|nr:methionyl-tRNA formyltransferase [Verrucomicrobiota bacterium]
MMRILFFGTSSFAARILQALIENGYPIVGVVTRPDRPRGRNLQLSPPPVKETLQLMKSQLPIFQPEKASAPDAAEMLRAVNADLFLVVAYGEIIKQNLLSMPRLGCVNIHASLLPKYRGAAPIQRCLMAGDKETGITLIEMSPQMDAGAILAKEAIPIPPEMTFGELEPKLCALSIALVEKLIKQLEKGPIVGTPQDHSLATLAPKLLAEEEAIDWNRSAAEIHNQIRALSPKPGAWCSVRVGGEIKRLKIKKSLVVDAPAALPGTLIALDKAHWIVACGTGSLSLLEVQLEGKKTLAIGEFVRGLHEPLLMT